MKLVASMIVKDEMSRYLPLAVGHLLTYVDEIRVLDDGSTDGTYEWCQDTDGVEVLRNPGPAFFEHEGRARQNLLNWVFESRADWVLGIDADEFVGDPSVVRDAVETATQYTVYCLWLVEAWKVDMGSISIRVDGAWGPRRVPMLYQLPKGGPPRRGQGRFWTIQDKQLACGREPIAVIREGGRAPRLGAEVFHFGWTREADRPDRAQRYFDHDGGKFHQNKHLQSILWGDERVKLEARPWPEGLRDLAVDLVDHAAVA